MSASGLIETIEDYLRSDSVQVRCNACVALGAVEGAAGEAAARRLMHRALSDEAAAVRMTACEALGKLLLPLRQAAVAEAAERRQRGEDLQGLQPALRALGADALRGTAFAPGLLNALAWNLTLREGMPRSMREFLSTSVGGLIGVAMLAALLVMPFAAWVEGPGGLRLSTDARMFWQLMAALFAALFWWLQSRRQAWLTRHLGRVQGVVVETLWTVAMASLTAMAFVLATGRDETMAKAPLLPALGLAASMAVGLRWGSWAGLLVPLNGADRKARVLTSMAAAIGAMAVLAWAVLRLLGGAVELSASLAGQWLPVFGAAMAAVALVVAWREGQESAAAPPSERWRALASLLGLGGLALLVWTLMEAERRLQGLKKLTAPQPIVTELVQGRWTTEIPVSHLPLRFNLLAPKPAAGNVAEGKLRLKVSATPFKDGSVDRTKDYEKSDPVLVIYDAESKERLRSFDDPEQGCMDMDKRGRTLVLRKLGQRGGDEAPEVKNWKDLTRTLLLRGAEEQGGTLATLRMELADAELLKDDKVCKGEDAPERLRPSADFTTDATLSTPYGVIRAGARVLLRKPDDKGEGPEWVDAMDSFNGKEVVVKSIDKTDTGYFRAEGDAGRWTWDKRWVRRVGPSAAAASAPAEAASR